MTTNDATSNTTGDESTRLATLAALFGPESPSDFDDVDGPVYWPSLTRDDAPAAWESLRCWVARFRARYPTQSRIPDCWWRHNELVEAFAALRDYERACFSATAPPTAAVEWHRAFRDMEGRWEDWVRRLRCAHDPSVHGPATADDTPPAGWQEWVRADAARRRPANHASE